MIKITNIIISLLYLILASLILQKFYGATLLLKGIQVASATAGNFLLIYSVHKVRWKLLDQIFLLTIMSSLLIGFLNVKNNSFLIYSIFPTINLIALSVGLLISVGPTYKRKIIIQQSLRNIIIIFVIITLIITSIELINTNRPFIFYRAVGLLFKPSSASFLACLTFLLIISQKKLRLTVFSLSILVFKSMSSLVFTLITLLDSEQLTKSKRARMAILLIGPFLGLFTIYLADLIYSRHLWVSVGTRFSIFSEFELIGQGLGFGTNIVLNAMGGDSRVSDGTLSLLKFQFGIFGIAWGIFLVFYALKLAIYTSFILGSIFILGLFAFNIPEVAFLSLLFPIVLFELNKNE